VSRSLIEQWFPAAIVGAESLRDASAAKKPPNSRLHVWWARRPLTASRAAIVGSLLPAWPSDEEAASDERAAAIREVLEEEFDDEDAYHAWFVRALGILGDPVSGRLRIKAANERGIKLVGNGYGYSRAFTVTPDPSIQKQVHRLAALRANCAHPPVSLDPFAGGGAIPFEASRYGLTAIANELNLVAAAILKGTVELPVKLGPSFETTIKRWGKLWTDRVAARLEAFFPREAGEAILAYVWAHTVPCPSTGHPTPLVSDLWLSRGNGEDAAIRLMADAAAGCVRTSVVTGEETKAGLKATYNRGTGTSIWTGETFGGDYIRSCGADGNIGQVLLAVALSGATKGRRFRSPTETDLNAIHAAQRKLDLNRPGWEIDGLVPVESIDAVSNYDRGHRMYGINRWEQFFTDRQLLSTVTALELLHEICHEARQELSPIEASAVGLYLAFALDKAVDYNSRQASWHATRLVIAHTFTKHNYAFSWSFAEWDAAHSLFQWATSQVADAYAGLAKMTDRSSSITSSSVGGETKVLTGSATNLTLGEASVDLVVTDPPYYDNVMYGECSDYFYVWLKRSLRDTWPELTKQSLSDKEAEAVANPALFKDVATHSGRGRRPEGTVTAAELADRHYESLLTRSFREAHRVLKPDGVLTVMFTHKRVDAWDTLGQSLLDAGFAIHSSWPVHTESEHSLHQAKKNSASSTIFLTCRKRETAEPAYWADIRGDVERAAEQAAARFAEQGIVGVDLTLATYGPVLSVLSRNWPVYTGELDPDGNPEVLRPDVALDLAREKVAALKKRGLLGGRDVEFDRLTDWWLLAWSDFQAAEFPFDEARKLSLALHLDVDDVAARKLVVSRSGTVTLQTPPQRRSARALDPDAASFSTAVDALHALMLLYEEEGLGSARAWLTRTGREDDQRFEALVRAALHAVPRVKKDDRFVRPEAAALEGIRTTLFPQIEAPADPLETAEQLVLDAV
jgi:adenine-specific DNA methylase